MRRTSNSFQRLSRHQRSRLLCEALEPRLLLSQTWIVTSGSNSTTNGTNLKNILDGTTLQGGLHLQYGDTIVLTANDTYYTASFFSLADLGATATVQLNGSSVNTNQSTITITNPEGGGYTAAPTVSFFGGGGSGAAATATIASGIVTSITITNAGTGYSAAPTVALIGGTPPITIESSDIYNGLGHLTGVSRVTPSLAQYMPTIQTDGATDIIQTVQSDSFGHSGAAHDYTFKGINIAPSGTRSLNDGLVTLGDPSINQSAIPQVPYNFIIDHCYIHGIDDLTNLDPLTNYQSGVELDCLNATVENSYISDFHSTSGDAQAINGSNGLGNFTITNNFLEATGENILFGGANEFVQNSSGAYQDPSNITITLNVLYKRLVWDPFSSSYDGTPMVVKNIFELKHATHVLFDQNLLENCWVGADERGQGIAIGPKNQYGLDTGALVHDVTITNNVIRNVGEGMAIYPSVPTATGGFTCLPAYNILIRNNLIEADAAGPSNGTGVGFAFTTGNSVGSNITIDENTVFCSSSAVTFGSNQPFVQSWTGFTFTNNVLQYGTGPAYFGTPGEGSIELNTFMSGIIVTNGGAGYTSAPLVTFTGGLGTGGVAATGKALINSATDTVYNIQITNNGSGYTSTPTIVFNNAGTGETTSAAATAPTVDTTTGDANKGEVIGWLDSGNVIFGNNSATLYTKYPPGDYIGISGYSGTNYLATEDTTGFQDPAGEISGLLSTSHYFTTGVNSTTGTPNGSTPGINSSKFSGIPDFVPVDSTLTGYWKFDEDTGSAVADSSSNGHAGTLSSSTLWTTNGQSDNAIALTGGTSGSVTITSFPTSSPFTFAAWINPTNNSGNSSYIASTNGTGNAAFAFSINTSGNLTVTVGATTLTDTSFNYYSTGTGGNSGKWYLVGVTYDTSGANPALTLYRNGTAVATNASASSYTAGSPTLYLGGNKGSVSSFDGSLDEVRYYSSSLTTTNLNGLTGMQQLYANFGPLMDSIYPLGGDPIITTPTNHTSNFSAVADDHNLSTSNTSTYTYTWTEVSGPAGGLSIPSGINGTNAAQSFVSTWNDAGNYLISLTITDGLGGSTTTYHPLVVPAIPQSASISPSNPTVLTNGTQQFTESDSGFDQFGNPLSGINYVWTVAAGGDGGSINSSGLYTAPATTGTDTIDVKVSGVIIATDPVTVTSSLPPNAPTNLTATPGTSSILLSWTDNATNETGFTVQRETPGGTWTTIATPGPHSGTGTDTYTDTTAATDGTAYFYQVCANGSPNSSFDATTCAVACPIAYEGFNYASVATWNGGDTGIGFGTNTWSLSSTTNSGIITGSLSYSSGVHNLTTSANSATLKSSATATETLASAVGAAGSTLWVSFEVSSVNIATNGDVQIGSSTNGVKFGTVSSQFEAVATAPATYRATSTIVPANNTTYFLACQIQYLSTGDIISLYVDPVSGVTPTSVSATVTLPPSESLTSTQTVTLISSGSAVQTFDELRLGASYLAVAPDPLAPNIANHPNLPPSQNDFSTPLTLAQNQLLPSALGSVLTATPFPTATLAWHTTSPDYHLYDSSAQDNSDPLDIFTRDPNEPLLVSI